LNDPNFAPPDPSALPDNILSAPAPQAAPKRRRVHRIFFGDEGLRAGWGILLFVLLCPGSNYTVSRMHLLPSQPHTTTGQSSPELPQKVSYPPLCPSEWCTIRAHILEGRV